MAVRSFRQQLVNFWRSRTLSDLRYLGLRQLGIKGVSFVSVSFAIRQIGPVGMGIAGYAVATTGFLTIATNLGLDTLLPKMIAAESNPEQKSILAARLLSLRFSLVVLSMPVFIFGAILQGWGTHDYAAPSGLLQCGAIWAAAYLLLIGNALNPQSISQGFDMVRGFSDAQFAWSLLGAFLLFAAFSIQDNVAVYLCVQALVLLLVTNRVFSLLGLAPRLGASIRNLAGLHEHCIRSWPVILTSLVSYGFGGMELFFISFHREKAETGMYNAAVTLSNGVIAFLALLPISLYPRLLSWHAISREMLIKRTVRLSGLIILSSPLLLCVMSPACSFAVPLILGSKFVATGPVLSALVVQYFLYISYFICTTTLILIGREKLALFTSICGAMLGGITYPLAINLGGALEMGYGKFLVYLLMSLVGLGMVLRSKSGEAEVSNRL